MTDEVQTLILKLKPKKLARNAKIGKDFLLTCSRRFARRSRLTYDSQVQSSQLLVVPPLLKTFCLLLVLVAILRRIYLLPCVRTLLVYRRHRTHSDTMMRPILKASALFSLLSTVASFSADPQRKNRLYPGVRLGSSAPRREGMSMTIYRGILTSSSRHLFAPFTVLDRRPYKILYEHHLTRLFLS